MDTTMITIVERIYMGICNVTAPPTNLYAPGPLPARGKTHPHHAGRYQRSQAAPPRSAEVLVLGLRPHGPRWQRETVRGHRPPSRREPRGKPVPPGRHPGPRAECAEESVAGLVRRVVHPGAPRPSGHGRFGERVRGLDPRTAWEGRQEDQDPADDGAVGNREADPR